MDLVRFTWYSYEWALLVGRRAPLTTQDSALNASAANLFCCMTSAFACSASLVRSRSFCALAFAKTAACTAAAAALLFVASSAFAASSSSLFSSIASGVWASLFACQCFCLAWWLTHNPKLQKTRSYSRFPELPVHAFLSFLFTLS